MGWDGALPHARNRIVVGGEDDPGGDADVVDKEGLEIYRLSWMRVNDGWK